MQPHKLDFRNKNHQEQLGMFARLITSLDALPAERREDAYLEELRSVDAGARASHAKIASLRADLKTELARRQTLFASARKSAQRAGVGALLKSQWTPAEVLAAGLDLAASNKAPVGLPAAPLNLRAEPTAGEGEAQLRWRRTVRRCTFEIEWHADPPDADHWQREGSATKAKFLAQGLVSGAKYWFRVRAINAHGASGWSNLASVRVK
jgi:Fibronectin type III domain